jgi:hypothetical protein
LSQDQVTQSYGGQCGDIILASLSGSIAHRFTGIHEHPGDQVGLLFILLEVETLGTSEHFPIDVFEIVSGNIRAMLGELHGEAMAWAAVPAGQHPFHHLPGFQSQPLDTGEDRRFRLRLRMEYHEADFLLEGVGLRYGLAS